MAELDLTIPGFHIACKTWGNPFSPPILALHGWLDNANSFAQLGELLQKDYYFIAVDLPGHGHSSHLPLGCNYHFSDGIFHIIEIIQALGLKKTHLLGHSMGACLASLVAGVSPDYLASLSLIEGLGPLSHPGDTACKQLAEFEKNISRKGTKKAKGYQEFGSAIEARAASGYVSYDIARRLCERGIKHEKEMFYWRHDRRLLIPSPLRMTEEQVLSCLKEIQTNTLLIWASKGFSFDNYLMKNRIAAVKNISLRQFEGGHHVHMEKPEELAALLAQFYQSA